MPMSYRFTEADYSAISAILGVEGTVEATGCIWQMVHNDTRQAQIVTLMNDIDYPNGSQGSAVIVQTKHGYFELHECSGYITFEPDEVIFVTERAEYISRVWSWASSAHVQCSHRFKKMHYMLILVNLHPSLIMSAMQLSLAEEILDTE
jgi:hypothetical protein